MPEDATFCPACGCSLDAQEQYRNQNQWSNNQNWNAPRHQPKDTGITLLLGVLLGLFGIMGIGQLYVGKIGRGVAILLGGFAVAAVSYIAVIAYILSDSWLYDNSGYYSPDFSGLIVIALLVAVFHLAYFIWQAYDAYKLAKKYNEELYRTGQPPW